MVVHLDWYVPNRMELLNVANLYLTVLIIKKIW